MLGANKEVLCDRAFALYSQKGKLHSDIFQEFSLVFCYVSLLSLFNGRGLFIYILRFSILLMPAEHRNPIPLLSSN